MLKYQPGPIDGVPDEVMACIPYEGPIHHYMWWVTQTTDTPPWLHVGPAIAAACTEIAYRGYLIGEHQERPRVWFALISDPGVGKSTAVKRMRGFHEDVLRTHGRVLSPYVTAEGTMSGIWESLSERWDPERGNTTAVLIREEFAALLSEKRRDDLVTTFCEWYDGGDFERHLRGLKAAARKGEKVSDTLRNATLSAVFATTPENLFAVAKKEHMSGGLFSRFGFMQAPGDWERLKIHPTHRPEERRSALGSWLSWFQFLDAQEALGASKIVGIPIEVQTILRDSLFEGLKQGMRNQDRLVPSRRRALVQATIIAGVYALTQGRNVILSDDMDAAVNLVEKSLNNLATLEPSIGTPFIVKQLNVAYQAIRDAGEIGLPKYRLYAVLNCTKSIIDQVLQTLLDEESVIETRVRTGKPGRPPMHFIATGTARFQGAKPEVPQGKVIPFPGVVDPDDDSQ